jgi:uncharacterized repeat protein (TIGR02543 family)
MKKVFLGFIFFFLVSLFFTNQFDVFTDYSGKFAVKSMTIKENESNQLVFSTPLNNVRLVSDNPDVAIVVDQEIIGLNPGHTVIRVIAPNGKVLDHLFIEIKPQIEPIYVVINGIEYIYEELPNIHQLPEPVRENHLFIGWRYKDDRAILNPQTIIDPSRPVVPVFERIPDVFVVVTLVSAGLEILDVVKVVSGSALTDMVLPEFIGFFDQKCPVEVDSTSFKINTDLTIILYEEPPFECDDDAFFVSVFANDYQEELILNLSSRLDDIFVPKINGFEFIGFTTSLNKNSEILTDFSFNTDLKDLELFANYEPLVFEIELALETRLLNPSIVAPYNTPIVPPEAPTRGGYTFIGWTQDKEGTIPFIFDLMPAQSIKVYPQWSINTYTLIIEPNNGTPLITENLEFFENLSLPKPNRLGFSFQGWYLDEAFTKPLTQTKMPAEDLYLYAKWDINIYTVTFVDLFNRPLRTTFVGHGETAPAPNVPNITSGNTLYVFRGWDNPHQNITSSITIKALYNQSTISSPPVQSARVITLTFESNGGTTVPELTQNEETSITLASPTRTGYAFEGWFEDSGLNSLFNATEMPSSDLTLYAKWTAKTYTIVFDGNGGTGTMESLSVSFSGIVSVPAISGITRTHYNFEGWNTSADGSGVNYFVDDNIEMNSEGINLYAIWSAVVYSISYDLFLSGVTNSNPTSYTVESGTITLTSPSRVGYTFNHWTLSNTQVTTIDASNNPQNITLLAHWTPNTYAIEFNPGRVDVTLATTSQTLTYDVNTSLAALSVSSSPGTINFVGWSLVSGGSVVYLDQDSVINLTPSGSITLYAIWQNEIEFTIIFNSNGGSEINSLTVVSGSTISAPTEPTKTGHTFAGWFIDDNTFNTSYDFSSVVTDSNVLYAKWTVNSYTIIFDGNGGTGTMDSQNVSFGSIVTLNPLGYNFNDRTFDGWSNNINGAKLFDDNQTFTYNYLNLTLYARWLTDQETLLTAKSEIEQIFTESANITFCVPNQNSSSQETALSNYLSRLGTRLVLTFNVTSSTKVSGNNFRFTLRVTKNSINISIENLYASFVQDNNPTEAKCPGNFAN